ncbi:hypothetical protein [Phenylobacterium sp.]|jgi:uncharacterized membrane protein YedE/YeeE|uniref:hypothetical protein n=1 Tax=Phenylobacterium sp. TaxID=1871053 RepID=UPI002F95A8D0
MSALGLAALLMLLDLLVAAAFPIRVASRVDGQRLRLGPRLARDARFRRAILYKLLVSCIAAGILASTRNWGVLVFIQALALILFGWRIVWVLEDLARTDEARR